jgi:hypothetical protein
MSTLEIAEKAVTELAPEEFERFLRWLSSQIGSRLKGNLERLEPTAEDRVERCDRQVREGSAVPFDGADMSRRSEPARLKATAIIARWHAEHGK